MRLREGTTGQKALFALIVGSSVAIMAMHLYVMARQIGLPTPGFAWTLSRTPPSILWEFRAGVAEEGLVTGSRWEVVNGVPAADLFFSEGEHLLHFEVGATNVLTIRQPNGKRVEVTLPVKEFTWRDEWFVNGDAHIIGTLYVLTCVLFFCLRPYEATSWAVLCLGVFWGATLFKLWPYYPNTMGWFENTDPYTWISCGYTGLCTVTFYHGMLAFPLPHRWLQHAPRRAAWLYLGAVPPALGWLGADLALDRGRPDLMPTFEAGAHVLSLVGICLLIGRQCVWAVGRRDRVIQQRARVLLLGFAVATLPITVMSILSRGLGLFESVLPFDLWPFALAIPLTLGYAMVRIDMFDARIAVRRAGAYVLAGAAAAVVIWAGAQVHALVAAACLLPVLYVAPRFNTRLNALLYPKRAQFPMLRRTVGDELAAAPTRESVLEILATAPGRVCETTSGAAFLLPGAIDGDEHLHGSGEVDLSNAHGLLDEPLIHLLVGTRQPIKRESLGVDQQFNLIREEARACMDRLHASVLFPIERDGKVIGGLAVGPHVSADVYDPAELELLEEIAHDAVHALATAELREQGRSAASSSSPRKTVPLESPHIAAGRYEIKRLLGEGAYKEVYLAHDSALARDVALALIKTEGLDETGRARLRREMQMTGRLSGHPHVVTVHDVGEADGQPYIVSECMLGGDLETLLEDAAGPLPLDQVLEIGDQLCQALEYAHGQGIVHRDLKSANIWFASPHTIKLGDFGLAVAPDESRVTQAGKIIGTVAYMAPEQSRGEAPDARSDLYALGVLLYEMVTGRLPFDSVNLIAIIADHEHKAPTPPCTLNPDLPAPLNDLILALLAKSPADRPQSAAEVREALQAIARGAPVAVAKPAPARGDIFVGREAELTRAEGLVQDAVRGHGKVLLLVGEPGIGKTRLATECGRVAETQGMRMLWGRCYEGEGAPAFWPWVQILRNYVRDATADRLRNELGDGAQHVAQMVSDVRTRLPDTPEPPQVDGEAGRFLLFDSTTRFLKNATAARPLTLVLEDLHWADKSSLLLLQFLAREMADVPLFVLGTYRDVDVDKKHPLAEALGQLAREPVSERVHLGGLSTQAVAALVDATGMSTESPELAAAVYDHTEGNPFFIKETLRHLQESGERIADMRVPEGVADVIRLRLAHLPAECTDLLRVAAVRGREFEVHELKAASGTDMDSTLAAVEQAERLGLVEATGEQFGQYWFTHALVRETMYEDLSARDRLRLHGQVGAALETVHANNLEPYLAQLSHHFGQAVQAGGDVDKAIDYAVRAAERATAQLAYTEAAIHYDQAIALLERRQPPDEHRRCNLLLELSYLYYYLGDPVRHERTCLKTLDLARALRDPDTFVETLTVLHDRHAITAGSDDLIFALIQEGLALLPEGDSSLRAQLLAFLSIWSTYLPGALEWRVALSEEALAMARRVGDPAALQRAAYARTFLIWVLPPAELVAAAREMHDLGTRVRDKMGALTFPALALLFLHNGYLTLGHVDDADACLAALEQHLTEMPQRYLRFYVTVIQATRALLAGRLDDGDHLAVEAFNLGQEVVPAIAGPVFVGFLLRLRWLQGRLAEFSDMYHAATEGMSDVPLVNSTDAYLNLELGREGEARKSFERLAVHDFTDVPRDLTTGSHLVNLCELACRLRDARRAAPLYDLLAPHADEVLVLGLNTACMGAVAHWLGMLAATMERWNDAEEHFRAALETNERIGARPFLACTQHEYARMLLTRDAPGDSAQAQALLAEATATYRELGMPTFLDQAEALEAQLA